MREEMNWGEKCEGGIREGEKGRKREGEEGRKRVAEGGRREGGRREWEGGKNKCG